MEKASVLTRSVAKCVFAACFVLLLLGVLFTENSAQTFARTVQAQLSSGATTMADNGDPLVNAALLLKVGDDAQPINAQIVFRKMTLNADSPTTGWFELYDDEGALLFDGRWVAMSYRNGETLLSLEGRGDGVFVMRRLKLKLKASTQSVEENKIVLQGQGSGEIR
jgi:hypothetical protein